VKPAFIPLRGNYGRQSARPFLKSQEAAHIDFSERKLYYE